MNRAPPTFRERAPTLRRTLAAIARAVEAGARGELAEYMTAAAAREIGGGQDRVAVARVLARSVRGLTYIPDEFGVEDVQTIERTSARGAGDCEDFVVAFAALARKAGLRTAAAIVSDAKGDPYHVYAAVQAPVSKEWIPADLTRNVPFGEWPALPEAHAVTLYPLQDEAGRSLSGIFDTLVGGAITYFGNKAAADAAKKVAKIDAAKTERVARAAEHAATVDAQRQVAEAAIRERQFAAVLSYAKKVTPYVLGIAALALVVKYAGTRRRGRR